MRVVFVALFAAGATASVPHSAPELPSGWSKLADPVSADHMVNLRLSLQQTNLDKMLEIAQKVSDPRSESYGQYLTASQLESLTMPTAAHWSTVENWMVAAKIPFKRVSHNVLEVSANVAIAASLLKTNFSYFANNKTGQRVVRADTYEVPKAVDEALAAVYGMHGFPLPLAPKELPGQPAKVTPTVIGKTYDVSGVAPSGSEKNRQAVAEFQGQTMKTSDLKSFFQKYVPGSPASAATVHKFVPSSGTGSAGVEASLDIEYIMGVAPGILTEFWYWKGTDFCADLQQWTSTILSTDDAPLVHSVSYGFQGPVSKLGCKTAQVTDIDTNFAKLAAKGITIIFASGDSGSGQTGLISQKLYPSWPASSPWVTAVGSTRFQDQTVGHAEMATDQFGSGGGFSTMFDAFDAQKAAVQNYLKIATNLPPSQLFPAGGRATPDVAALGEGYQVVTSGRVGSVGGTSASAPAFAAHISLLNEARLKAGKPAMGYLNSWLYLHPDVFTDITVGTNAIGRGGQKVKYGFACAKGWDPVTGLGTPIFSKMLSAAMAANATSEVVVV